MYMIRGFIRNIRYEPRLAPTRACLPLYDLAEFDVNNSAKAGIIDLGDNDVLAFSQWTTPKRTRTYPFARVYDTYRLNTKKVTIIPIIKDEGADTQNNDRINFITFSWMSLLNIFIILAWYEDADRKDNETGRITNQILNNEHIIDQISKISRSQASALHWNTEHFESDFESVYRNAVESYSRISKNKCVRLHSTHDHLRVLEDFQRDGSFNLDLFRDVSLRRSGAVARREIATIHELESLSDGDKALFHICNYLGGVYYLTADEVYWRNDRLIIQESKNSSSSKLPSETDIKDGLFKLILFSNIHRLYLDESDTCVQFSCRLKLTGDIEGSLELPIDPSCINSFCIRNNMNARQNRIIGLLNQEAASNCNLQIIITDRT